METFVKLMQIRYITFVISINILGTFLIDFIRIFQIIFPGVTEYTFHKLLCYLYTDEIPQISADKCLNLLELANRLCLPRLLNLVECRVIEDLTKIAQIEVSEGVQHCLKLLESVKVRVDLTIDYLKKKNLNHFLTFSVT